MNAVPRAGLNFRGTCISAAVISTNPGRLRLARIGVRQCLNWMDYVQSSNYQSCLTTVGSRKVNDSTSDRSSCPYWANSPVDYCPHRLFSRLALRLPVSLEVAIAD